MSTEELIRDIKKELRAGMNGILSAKMREAGMPYKLIFGVELPRLQSIADVFPKNAELANQLWSQNIRETKLLAIMLMPPDAFTPAVANAWADKIQTPEEAQVMAKYLLQKVGRAKDICIAWLQDEKPLPTICACLCLRHILANNTSLNAEERQIIKEHTNKILPTANLHLRKAILALFCISEF